MSIKYFECPEMKKLRKRLDKENISWTDHSSKESDYFWMCRTRFEYKGHRVSVIHGIGSYGGIFPGADIGGLLLEVMIDGKEPVGSCKAKDIFEMMRGL